MAKRITQRSCYFCGATGWQTMSLCKGDKANVLCVPCHREWPMPGHHAESWCADDGKYFERIALHIAALETRCRNAADDALLTRLKEMQAEDRPRHQYQKDDAQKPCPACGKTFRPTTRNQRSCSRSCSILNRRKRAA